MQKSKYLYICVYLLSPLSICYAQEQDNFIEISALNFKSNILKKLSPGSQGTELRGFNNLKVINIPYSVQVINRKTLDEQGSIGIYDALKNVSGVVRNQQSGVAYDQLSIRGITLDNRSNYMFNGILPFDNNLPIPMEDKEQVEVLKGASALSYGFVAPAGVINLVTKRATSKPIRTLSFSTDTNGTKTAHVDVGQTLGESNQFGIRINGLISDIHSPIESNTGYRNLINAAIDWNITDHLKLKYDFEYIKAKITEQAAIVPPKANKGIITLPNTPNPRNLLSMKGKDTSSYALTNLLQAEYELNSDWKIKSSIGQSTTYRNRWLWVFDNYNTQTGEGTVYGADQANQKYVNSNIRTELEGKFTTFDLEHNLITGVSFNKLYQPSFYTYMYSSPQNIYNPATVTDLIRSPQNTKKTLKDRSYLESADYDKGIYLQDRMKVSDNLTVTTGLRAAEYRTTQLNKPSSKTSKITPSASVTYEFLPRTNIYASYIQGLESVGVAPVTAINAGSSLPAATSTQKELGIKSEYFNDMLLTASVFTLDRKSASLNANDYYEINGKEQYKGIEIAAQGQVTKDFSIIFSSTHIDAKVKTSSNHNIVGKSPENVPKYTWNLFTSYNVPYVENLSINAGLVNISQRPINDQNMAYIPSYTIYSAGLNYKTMLMGHNTRFKVNIDNLTNKRYWSAAGSGQLAVGMPRTALFNMSMDF